VKALVTGAGGMLGHALVPRLEAAGHAVLPLTRADADVTRSDALDYTLSTFHPDVVFHLAAFTRVDDCETHAEDAHRVNALGSRHVALAAAKAQALLVAISTDYVFSGDARTPYREYDAVGPRSVYGASKWAGEEAIRELYARHAIVRTGWLFGKGGANFIDTILRKGRAGESLRVVDDQRGAPTWTADLADALVRLAEGGHVGTFHMTSAGEGTWFDVATHVLESAGVKTALARTDSKTLARPAVRPAYSVLSNDLVRQVLGAALPEWRDAVQRYLAGVAAPAGKETS